MLGQELRRRNVLTGVPAKEAICGLLPRSEFRGRYAKAHINSLQTDRSLKFDVFLMPNAFPSLKEPATLKRWGKQ